MSRSAWLNAINRFKNSRALVHFILHNRCFIGFFWADNDYEQRCELRACFCRDTNVGVEYTFADIDDCMVLLSTGAIYCVGHVDAKTTGPSVKQIISIYDIRPPVKRMIEALAVKLELEGNAKYYDILGCVFEKCRIDYTMHIDYATPRGSIIGAQT